MVIITITTIAMSMMVIIVLITIIPCSSSDHLIILQHPGHIQRMAYPHGLGLMPGRQEYE